MTPSSRPGPLPADLAGDPVVSQPVPSPILPLQSAYLDLLRAGAAMVVALAHADQVLLVFGGRGTFDLSAQLAVITFFFISGFLICHTATRPRQTGRYGLVHYLIDRFARIYSVYFPALVAVAAIGYGVTQFDPYAFDAFPDRTQPPGAHTGILYFIGNMLMLQEYPILTIVNRLQGGDFTQVFTSYAGAAPFWSVVLEFWMYMSFGILYFMVRDRGQGSPGAWTLLLLAVALGSSGYNVAAGNGNCLTLVWLLGALACVGRNVTAAGMIPRAGGGLSGRVDPDLMASLAGAILCLVWFALRLMTGRLESWFDLQLALFFCGFLFCLYVGLGAAARSWRQDSADRPGSAGAVRFVASYSYSLYCTHYAVLLLLRLAFGARFRDSGLVGCLAALAVANGVAFAFFWLFERHHRAIASFLKARLAGRQSGGLPMLRRTKTGE